MGLFKRAIGWVKSLPSSWIRANIHSSLLISLSMLIFGIYALSHSRLELAEFRTLTLSLPVIWVISLTVRIAAQHLAIGVDSLDLETRLGPTGNLTTDYEFLRPQQILRYALAGHAATWFLVALGLAVTAASLPFEITDMNLASLASLLDIHSGWTSRAWATQIFWVNLMIAVLNSLPTIPFDNRALLYGLAHMRSRSDESSVLRGLASFDSHLACLLIGCGLATLMMAIFSLWDSPAWYAMMAGGVYLFIASRWEITRASRVEQQVVSFSNGTAKDRHHAKQHTPSTHHRSNAMGQATERQADSQATMTTEALSDSHLARQERRIHVSEAYLDEILRKLHREGAESLSVREQEALLTASQKLKEKHKIK